MNMTAVFTTEELELLQEALMRAASRHDSEAKSARNTDNAEKHIKKSDAMHKLWRKISQMKTKAA